MQVLRDAGTFRFEGVLAFESFPFVDFVFELGGALFHQPAQLGVPDDRNHQNHRQQAQERQEARQRPPGWLG